MRRLLYCLLPLLLLLTAARPLSANEGMWLPLLLQSLNEEDMQALGMRISAEDIYSVNQGSLKDAIVHFGGFCTGEIISDQGLLLTNHHCGYGQIQSHSSMENNFLENGFWAQNLSQELPNPGLFVEFIVRIEDVTEIALLGLSEDLSPADRQSLIDKNLETIRENAPKEEYQGIKIRPFFNGNQYFMFVTERYNDVRLVAAPPSSIGKFGADTDNWEWPRHTGDFSLFRVYSGPDGKPADYSEDNIPLQPKYHLPISLSGVAPGDFTMVFGFPGRTDQYLTSSAMAHRTEVINPIRVSMRDSSLSVIDAYMRADPEIKLQYASRQARIANAWKKWRGESEGVAKTDGIEKRKRMEDDFIARIKKDHRRQDPNRRTIQSDPVAMLENYEMLNRIVSRSKPYAETNAVVREVNYNIDLFRLSNYLQRVIDRYDNNGLSGLQSVLPQVQAYLEGFYENYRPEVDQAVMHKLLPIYFEKVRKEHQSPTAQAQVDMAGGHRQLVDHLFENSFLVSGDRLLTTLSDNPEGLIRQLKGDPALAFVNAINDDNERLVLAELRPLEAQKNQYQTKYMAHLMEVFTERTFWPDANGTMRVSYGQAEGYLDGDGIQQGHMTYLSGVIAKYQPGDYEFDLPAKLIELYEAKDFGDYATESGQMPVCFLGSNHTSGGNSGSPAIDADGRLVGLNFDRVWEGTMSDIHYDRSICRNIMVDIRYVLFLIDKLGGAGHLIEEMTVIK